MNQNLINVLTRYQRMEPKDEEGNSLGWVIYVERPGGSSLAPVRTRQRHVLTWLRAACIVVVFCLGAAFFAF